MKTMLNDNTLKVDRLEEITPEDVAWLKSGSYVRGSYVRNDHGILYTTSRGVQKEAKCFVRSDGTPIWRTVSARQTYDRLSDEEAKWLDPETYAKRKGRKDKRKAKRDEALAGAAGKVKVGDLFVGSFGYEANIHRFFVVTKVTTKTVTVCELAEGRIDNGWCEWKSRPILDKPVGKTETHKLRVSYDGTPYVAINTYMNAYHTPDYDGHWFSNYNYH